VRFTEVSIFGVYVAPMAPMMLAAWLVLLPVRRIAGRLGLLNLVWHPSLFVMALYTIVLALIVLCVRMVN
jgi:protein AaeX